MQVGDSEDPQPHQLRKVGTVAVIRQMAKGAMGLQILVEGVLMIEITSFAVAERDVLEVLVVGVLVDDHDAVRPEVAHDVACDQSLSRAGAAREADEDSARHGGTLAPRFAKGQRAPRAECAPPPHERAICRRSAAPCGT